MIFSKKLAGQSCTFDLRRRKRQKRLIVTPVGPNHYRVTVPKHLSQRAIEKTLEAHAETLLALKPTILPLERMIDAQGVFIFGVMHHLDVVTTTPSALKQGRLILNSRATAYADIQAALSKQLESLLRQHIDSLVIKHKASLSHLGCLEPMIQYRMMKTKFGSCRPSKGRITLNLELIHYPKPLIEYIFLHEISHFKHPDHSARFYQTLEALCPKHRTYKKILDDLRQTLLKAPLEQYEPGALLMSEPVNFGRLS